MASASRRLQIVSKSMMAIARSVEGASEIGMVPNHHRVFASSAAAGPRRCGPSDLRAGSSFVRHGDLLVGRDVGGGNFLWRRHAAAVLPPPRGFESGSIIVFGSDGGFGILYNESDTILRHAGPGIDDAEGWRLQPLTVRALAEVESASILDDIAARARIIKKLLQPASQLASCSDDELISAPAPALYLNGIFQSAARHQKPLCSQRSDLAAAKRFCSSMDCDIDGLADTSDLRDGKFSIGLRVALDIRRPRQHRSDHRTAFLRPSSSHSYTIRRCLSSWGPQPPPHPPKPDQHNFDDWHVNVPPALNANKTNTNTIDEILLSMKFDPIQFAMANKLVETFTVLGETWEFCKLREPTKYLYTSLLTLVKSYHEMDSCFTQISEATVLITSDWKFVLLEGTFALTKWTATGADRNYRDIAALFRKLIWVSAGSKISFLEDFNMLLHAMEFNASRKKIVIHQHTSLLPIGNFSAVYLRLYELVRKILPAEGRAQVACQRIARARQRPASGAGGRLGDGSGGNLADGGPKGSPE
uniref:Uncharacterized protein n=1 Tax=Leersia perrieri TaxID=77586 RepID=A0A0D9VBZ4_9ORYZ